MTAEALHEAYTPLEKFLIEHALGAEMSYLLPTSPG